MASALQPDGADGDDGGWWAPVLLERADLQHRARGGGEVKDPFRSFFGDMFDGNRSVHTETVSLLTQTSDMESGSTREIVRTETKLDGTVVKTTLTIKKTVETTRMGAK
ncbi:MAG: hypothetical protein ACYC6M_03075 [Terriglobales bacterium]